jgi:23S rRNA pseudouridine2605 synthase
MRRIVLSLTDIPDNSAVPNSNSLRLQVFLAHAGIASRRAAEKLIVDGRVTVNGSVVNVLGSKVSIADVIAVDGAAIQTEKKRHYLALNKPPLYLCSSSDPENRPLAKDLLPAMIRERLYNVGRLDYLSCGLILFTNDGNFAAEAGHPRAQIEKEYLVEATGLIPDAVLEDFLRGIAIEGTVYRCRHIEKTGKRELRIVLIEGKNREIRRVFSYFHLHPKRLCRVRIGPVSLGSLTEGKTRPLNAAEIQGLRSH